VNISIQNISNTFHN